MTWEMKRKGGRIEWPTLLVALLLYAGFVVTTWYWQAMPLWLLAIVGGYLAALHGSLQHEVIHGHPTPWRGINRMLVLPSLWIWLPFERYRDSHLKHHENEHLTDPLEDPESFYVTAEAWARLSWPSRVLLTFRNTLAGRLLVGPLVCIWRVAASELPRLIAGDRYAWQVWAIHAIAAGTVLAWAVWVCGMPLWVYFACFVYPGVSFTLLRSFAEHRAVANPRERSAIVEAGPLFSLLFLNNNLHALHHARPDLPWYALSAAYRQRRHEVLEENGGYRFAGYGEVACRYLLRPKGSVVHPFVTGRVDAQPAAMTSREPAIP